jgi:putative transposase
MGLGLCGTCAPRRHWLHAPLDFDETSRIRAYMAQERALGEPCFQAMVEKALNRPAAVRRRGRPVRTTEVAGTLD